MVLLLVDGKWATYARWDKMRNHWEFSAAHDGRSPEAIFRSRTALDLQKHGNIITDRLTIVEIAHAKTHTSHGIVYISASPFVPSLMLPCPLAIIPVSKDKILRSRYPSLRSRTLLYTMPRPAAAPYPRPRPSSRYPLPPRPLRSSSLQASSRPPCRPQSTP